MQAGWQVSLSSRFADAASALPRRLASPYVRMIQSGWPLRS
jgi:hypothetical protein